jgi:hypothetical protein
VSIINQPEVGCVREKRVDIVLPGLGISRILLRFGLCDGRIEVKPRFGKRIVRGEQ